MLPNSCPGPGSPNPTPERNRATAHPFHSITINQEAIRRLFRIDVDNAGNLPPMRGVCPDHAAPIVRNTAADRVLAMAR